MRIGIGFAPLRLLALWLALVSCLHAADPVAGEWTMFGNGPSHSGFYPRTIGSGTFTEAWSKQFTTAINQVVIRADTIYGTTNGYFTASMRAFALNAADGSEKWSYALPQGHSVNPSSYADGRLYFQRGNHSSDTHLWCLDAASGRLLWAAPHSAQWERYLAPTIAGGGVFVNGGSYGGMYGFDAQTGTQRFFVSLGQEDGWTPAYAEGVVYTCVNGIFTAHNPATGSQLWTRDLKTTSTGAGYGNSWYDGNVPVISDGKASVVGGSRIVVVDLASRTQLWSLPGNYAGVPAMAGGVVYACLGAEVKAYNAATGAVVGSYTGTGTLSGQPIVTNDLVIASGTGGTFIFNKETFALKQTLTAGGTVSYASGLLCVSKGEIGGSSTGSLTTYRVQPAEEDPAPAPLPPPAPLETRTNPSRTLGNTTAAWIDCVRAGGIVYFLFDTPAKLERYEIATGAWLTPISLPGTPKALAVSTNGIYVSFGKSVSLFSLDGATETPLLNTVYETRSLFERSGKLYLADQSGTRWTVVETSTGMPFSTKEFSYSGVTGVAVSSTTPNLYGVSGSDISRTEINSDGSLGAQASSRYYGDYPSGTRIFLFPGEARVATNGGIVYSASDLTYLGSLAGAFKDLDFTSDAAPIVLRDSTLVAYSTGLLETGRKTLSAAPLRIFIQGDTVHSFARMDGRGVAATTTAISSIAPNQPNPAVDPTNLTYTPDALEYGKDGIVYLLSKLHQSVFRWSVAERKYLTSISLVEVPQLMAYSATLDRLYLSYASGRISYLNLGSTTPSEVNFVNSPQPPLGIEALDDLLFVCDNSGAWESHYVYDSSGKLASSTDWKYFSREYTWSTTNRKLYFFRDGTSPNDIIWEDIDLEGKIGAEKDSPYHGDYGVQLPIRVSPDGTTVLLGNGHLYAGVSLERKGALANAITDAVWQGGKLFTVRSLTPLGGTAPTSGELQAWDGTSQLTSSGPSSGVPLRLFPLADSLLVVSQENGKVRFTRYGLDFTQISSDPGNNQPPPTGLQPRPNPSRPLGSTTAKWIDSAQANGIAYFLFDTPAKVERYDLATESWLTPISLPTGPKVMTASPNGIFVSFGNNVSIFSLDGSTETPLLTAAAEVRWLHELSGKLYVMTSTGEFGLVSTTTGAVLSSKKDTFYSLRGLSFSPQKNKIFGRDSGVSPSDIHFLALNADGTFGTTGESPYHGDYPSASRTYMFPNGELVADDSGIVYATTNLTYVGSLAGKFDDLAFAGNAPVALRGNTLVVFTSNLVEAARTTLAGSPLRLMIAGQQAFTFAMQSGRGVTVSKLALNSITMPPPAPVVNPTNLTYVPDQIIKGPDDVVYLLSKQHRNVFRWSVSARAYLPSIPLIDQPLLIAHSEANHRLYVGYSSGRISWIDLSATTLSEQPFVNLPQAVAGLAAAGEFLFAADRSGAWATHYTFNSSGQLVSSEDWNYLSNEYVWSAAQQKMYFFRDDTSPNDLLWEAIDGEGKIGVTTDTPYHGDYQIIHPIRVSPDGAMVVLGSGDLYDGTSLNHVGSLQQNSPRSPLIDAAWLQGTLHTLASNNTGTAQLIAWSSGQPAGTDPNYSISKSVNLQGTPLRLYALTDRLVAVSSVNGRPRFSVFNTDLDRISYDPASNTPDPDPNPDPEPEPFGWREVKGTYTAVFSGEGSQKLGNSGLLRITLTGGGRFTGILQAGSRAVPIRGKFAPDGSASISFTSSGATYTLTLNIEVNEGTPVLSGTVATANWTASLESSRIWVRKEDRYLRAGQYTVTLSDPNEYIRVNVPPVAAVGTLRVRNSGAATLFLNFATGQRTSYGGRVSEDGNYPVFAVTHGGQGHLHGNISLNAIDELGEPTSILHWIKPLQLKAPYYPLDIVTDLEFAASPYQWRKPMLDVAFSWPTPNSAAVFIAGDLQETTGQATYLNRQNQVLFAKDDEKTVLKFSPDTGLITGSFIHPRTGQKSPLTGVLFQAKNRAVGYFHGLRSCGVFFFGPMPPAQGSGSAVSASSLEAGAMQE